MNTLSYRQGPYTVTVEVKKPVDVFTHMGPLMEILDGVKECGACHSTNIQFAVRPWRDGTGVTLLSICNGCGCALKWWARKDGSSVWPCLTDGIDGPDLPNGGWVQKEDRSAETPTQPAKQPVSKPVVRADDVDESDIPF